MDELDRRLVALLRADGRKPVATLAQALEVSRGTVQNRIDRLLERGEVQGFTVKLRPDQDDGRVRAVMTLSVEGRRTPSVIKALAGLAEVEAVHATNGRWDLVVELNAAGLAAFSRTLDAIRAIDAVAASETSLLLDTRRF